MSTVEPSNNPKPTLSDMKAAIDNRDYDKVESFVKAGADIREIYLDPDRDNKKRTILDYTLSKLRDVDYYDKKTENILSKIADLLYSNGATLYNFMGVYPPDYKKELDFRKKLSTRASEAYSNTKRKISSFFGYNREPSTEPSTEPINSAQGSVGGKKKSRKTRRKLKKSRKTRRKH
jgi:hypothetical protein